MMLSSSTSDSKTSRAKYHQLNQFSSPTRSPSPNHQNLSIQPDSDSSSNNNQNSKIKNSSMGAFHRFLKYGGWQRNTLLSTISVILFIIFSRPHSSPLRYLTNPISSSSSGILNALSTQSCQSAPTQRYALMIDAGSTGSRIHVYRFSSCKQEESTKNSKRIGNTLPTLDHELFFKTQPGLSSYAGKPKEAAESLRPLLQAALEGVPFDERRCTPISVKATAGLRLLGERESSDILKEVENWLRAEWPFRLAEKNPVAIMDGADEGVYAWVTINYLLKTIGSSSSSSSVKGKNLTAAVMDLGGASTQIVFEPTKVKLEPGPHSYHLSFGKKTHNLYQHSHLGYGLMEARRSVHQFISYSEMWRRKISWSSLSNIDNKIGNPCIQKDSTKKVLIVSNGNSPTTGDKDQVQNLEFLGVDTSFENCERLIEVTISKQATCKIQPCAFGGVYQPRLSEAFSDGPIYALSYFYDRLYPLGIKSRFTLNQLSKLAETVCKGPDPSTGVWNLKDFKLELERGQSEEDFYLPDLDSLEDELNGRPEACLDLSFIFGLLNFGYEIDRSREIIISKKINGVELGWALGATIDLIEKNKIENCRIS